MTAVDCMAEALSHGSHPKMKFSLGLFLGRRGAFECFLCCDLLPSEAAGVILATIPCYFASQVLQNESDELQNPFILLQTTGETCQATERLKFLGGHIHQIYYFLNKFSEINLDFDMYQDEQENTSLSDDLKRIGDEPPQTLIIARIILAGRLLKYQVLFVTLKILLHCSLKIDGDKILARSF